MWPTWLSSPRRITTSTTPTTPTTPRNPISRTFSCSSFKDIDTLLADSDSGPGSESACPTPRSASIFHRLRISTSVLRAWGAHNNNNNGTSPLPPASKATIVLYFTTLRVVRKTFEDCRVVRSILRGFRVPIDERDLSMDASYLGELQSTLLLLGGSRGCKGGKVTLPCVFIGGRLIGGAEEVRQLHESGELKRLLSSAGLSLAVATGVCEACGGVRFVVCEECSGSHKIYSAKVGGFRSCAACNVNGLIRCPHCLPQHLPSTES